jgi:hypothetical protein
LKSAALMWSPLVAQPIGSATVTFPYQRHAKPSGSSPPMHKLGKFTKLRVAFLEYAGGVVDKVSPNVARFLPPNCPGSVTLEFF